MHNSFGPLQIRDLVQRFRNYAKGFKQEGLVEPNMSDFSGRYWKDLPEEVLSRGVFTPGTWSAFIQSVFLQELTGGHTSIGANMPPLGYFLQNDQCQLFGFPLVARLGVGSSAVVYEVADGYALKVMPAGKSIKLEKEYNILRQIRNRSVVRVFDFFKNRDCTAMLMEKVIPGKAIHSDYMEGLKAIHRSGFVHGDLREVNLGVSAKGNGMIFDLGCASFWSARKAEKELTVMALLTGVRRAHTVLPGAEAGRQDRIRKG